MTARDLCYAVSPYQRALWRQRTVYDPGVAQAEREGASRYENFRAFASEVFHRLYDEQPKPLDAPAPGADVFARLHEEIGKLPEFADLAARCNADEEWAGIGTASVVDTLLRSVDEPPHQVEDPAADEQAAEFLRRLLEDTEAPAEREALEEAIAGADAAAAAKREAAAEAAAMVDPSQVRNAVRAACAHAQESIEEQQQIVDGLGAGLSPHAGRTERRAIARKLAPMVAQSAQLRRIAELAGRLRRIAEREQARKPRKGTDEIAGVELGDDLRRLVPAEALYLDDEVDAVFARKLLERALMLVEVHKRPPKERGPLVLCLDSSGSMSGDPQAWASAVALAFVHVAQRQGRACAILHFGTKVMRVDEFPAKVAPEPERLVEALTFFDSSGGTCFEPPLQNAADIIERGSAVIGGKATFEEADIVFVTDGEAHVSDAFRARWRERQAALGFRLWTILVGGARGEELGKLSDQQVVVADVLRDDREMHRLFGAV